MSSASLAIPPELSSIDTEALLPAYPCRAAPVHFQAFEDGGTFHESFAQAIVLGHLFDIDLIDEASLDGDGTLRLRVDGDSVEVHVNVFAAFSIADDVFFTTQFDAHERAAMRQALTALASDLEIGFMTAVSAGTCTVTARVKPDGQMRPIAADVFEMFEIVDWERGIAAAPGGHYLYSIQASPSVQPSARRSVDELLATLRKTRGVRGHVSFFLKTYPEGLPDQPLNTIFAGYKGSQNRNTYGESRAVYREIMALPRDERARLKHFLETI